MVLLVAMALVALTLAGVMAREFMARAIAWVFSIPPFLIGLLALLQGGIVEPFSKRQLLVFCSIAFMPLVGCLVGRILSKRQ